MAWLVAAAAVGKHRENPARAELGSEGLLLAQIIL